MQMEKWINLIMKEANGFSMIRTAMYFYMMKKRIEKNSWASKKKVSSQSPQPVLNTQVLDLSQDSTEEAVNKITTIFKEGEAKAQGML